MSSRGIERCYNVAELRKLALMSLHDIAMKPKWVYKHLTCDVAGSVIRRVGASWAS